MPVTVSDVRADPVPGRRSRPLPGLGFPESVRRPSAQDKRGGLADLTSYPYDRGSPSTLAQGRYIGKNPSLPLGYSPVDYGAAPVRIPRQWRDGTRYWDGLRQQGFTQQFYQAQMRHFRPAPPTRGYRSVSGVLAGQGQTASRMRIPSVFVPSAVS